MQSRTLQGHLLGRVLGLGLAGGLLLLAACQSEHKAAPPPPVVEVAEVIQRDVPGVLPGHGSVGLAYDCQV